METILKKDYDQLQQKYHNLQARFDELEEYLKLLQRSKFAAKSESLTHPGMKLLFEDEPEKQSDPAEEEKEVKGYTPNPKNHGIEKS